MPSPRPPLRARLVPLVVAAGVALAGCGSAEPEPTSPYPLQLRLSGGQTARDDRLVVQADGHATGSVRPTASGTGPAEPVACSVDAAFLADLARAAAQDLAPGGTVPAGGGDMDIVTVTGPTGAAYGMGDDAPEVTRLARRLLDDTALPATARRICR